MLSPSSRGLGHCPFTAATGVRIPLGTPQNLTYISLKLIKTMRASLKSLKLIDN